MLLQECDRRGSTLVAAQTESKEAVVATWIANGNERDQQAVEEAGFLLVKRTLLMCIEMEHCPAKPHWPEGIQVRSVIPGQDDRAICILMAEGFEGTHLEPATLEEWREAMMSWAQFQRGFVVRCLTRRRDYSGVFLRGVSRGTSSVGTATECCGEVAEAWGRMSLDATSFPRILQTWA